MVKRGRTSALIPPSSGQRRLDEIEEPQGEAATERNYHRLRRSPSGATPLPYEARVEAWIRLREEAVRKRETPADPARSS